MIFKKETFLEGKIKSARVYCEFFALNKNDIVLNIGCGQGAQALAYKGQFKKMIGVDINCEKLKNDSVKVENYETICANVENIPLENGMFDRAIAIDIIEHVLNPRLLCLEARRLLKSDGEILIGFPMTYDKYRDFFSWIGKIFWGRKKAKSTKWNPDAHNQKHSFKEWIDIIRDSGFCLQRIRATSLFPPLHLFGIPRFWFTNNIIHKIDSFLCRTPIINRLGLTMICVFKKK